MTRSTAMPYPRLVLDTSVLFSYLWSQNKPFAIKQAMEVGHIECVTCESALAELRTVSLRHLDPGKVDAFLTAIRKHLTVSPEPTPRFVLHTDAKDSVFFDLAIESSADYLVTYDKAHMLPVRETGHPQRSEFSGLAPNTKIVTPAEAAKALVGP